MREPSAACPCPPASRSMVSATCSASSPTTGIPPAATPSSPPRSSSAFSAPPDLSAGPPPICSAFPPAPPNLLDPRRRSLVFLNRQNVVRLHLLELLRRPARPPHFDRVD